jgi:4-hydroxymandelate oxidase
MQALSLRELEQQARDRLDPAVYDFFAGGADDEVTLRANEAAFARIGLVPRVLSGGGRPRLEVELLGSRASMPVVIAPTAFHRLAHPDGERATARAAAAAGTVMIASMASTVAIEEIAAAVPGPWFQLYIQPDLGFTADVVRRAEAAGCAALVVTVDSPVFGHRERDLRHGFAELPDGMCCENMRDGDGPPRPFDFTGELSWEHVEWLRAATALPIALKGVAHPQDARLAVSAGVDALVVSNHGGRQLDGTMSSIRALPEVVDAVGDRLEVWFDGGIRSGQDVLRALALGAHATLIGRAFAYGLGAMGEAGVTRALEIIQRELDVTMALCGLRDVREANRSILHAA